MADKSGSEQDKNAEAPRGPSAYERMSPPMQKLWEEKLFNSVKQRNSLLVAGAVLTWAFLLWMLLACLFLPGLVVPTRFPIYKEACFSLGIFLVYHFIMGFVRKQTERNLVTLSAQHHDPHYHKSEEFKAKKPFHKEEDPPVARAAYRLRSAFGLPRRGLSQTVVLLFQFFAAIGYIGNYVYYVFWLGAIGPEHFSTMFWLVHATVTAGGILILFKNYGFLVDTNRLIKNIEGLAGSILGHAHANVTVEESAKKPCEDKCEKHDGYKE